MSTLDLRSGYFAVPIRLFKLAVFLPLIALNALALFQNLLDVALGYLKWKIMAIYHNDLLNWAESFSQMLQRFEIVLQKLREANL